MLQNSVPKKEVTEGLLKLGNEELQDLCFSPHIIGEIKLKRMGRSGHVAHV